MIAMFYPSSDSIQFSNSKIGFDIFEKLLHLKVKDFNEILVGVVN